jgi:hypothetical protein
MCTHVNSAVKADCTARERQPGRRHHLTPTQSGFLEHTGERLLIQAKFCSVETATEMLFLPPIVPPVGLGRFRPADIQHVKKRCTEPNHPYSKITREEDPQIRDLDGFLWSYDHNRIRVCLTTCGHLHVNSVFMQSGASSLVVQVDSACGS